MYNIDWLVDEFCFVCIFTSLIMTMLHSDIIPLSVGMDDQMKRMATFRNLPESIQVFPSMISKVGFYYTGGDTVICYGCGLRVNFSDLGVDPMIVHRQRSPECPFVSQPSRTTEVTNITRSPYQESSSEVEMPDTGSATTTATTSMENTHVVSSSGERQSHSGSGAQRRRGRSRRRDYYAMLASFAGENRWHPHYRRNPRTSPYLTALDPNPQLNPMLTYDTGTDTGTSIADLLNIFGMTISDVLDVDNDATDNPRSLEQRINDNDPTLLDEMKYERHRLATYANWPADITIRPAALARDGLFYLCRADRVKCVFCFGIIRNWQPSENNPTEKHRRLFPRCPFLRDPRAAGNIAVGDEPSEGERLNVTTNEAGVGQLGIQTSRPLNPAMAIESRRLDSFDTYPQDNPMSRERLASAGFYYSGNADEVRCFFCNERISRWQYNDDPMTKHRQLRPDCGFVRLVAEVERDPPTSADPNSEDALEEGGTTAPSLVCPVCNVADRSIVFLPCGHLACCTNCATSRTTCPSCGGEVRGSVQAFLS